MLYGQQFQGEGKEQAVLAMLHQLTAPLPVVQLVSSG